MLIVFNVARSRPLQKEAPAPVRTTTRTPGAVCKYWPASVRATYVRHSIGRLITKKHSAVECIFLVRSIHRDDSNAIFHFDGNAIFSCTEGICRLWCQRYHRLAVVREMPDHTRNPMHPKKKKKLEETSQHNQRKFWFIAMERLRTPDEQKRWRIIYPAYINKRLKISEGRKIPSEHCVMDPLVTEIAEVCQALKFPCVIEVTQPVNGVCMVFRTSATRGISWIEAESEFRCLRSQRML